MDLEPRGKQPPKIRASDAERERTVARLRHHHADGRLDLEEFEQRVGQAYAARTVDELDHLMRDLPAEVAPEPAPAARPAPAGQPAPAGTPSSRRRGFYRALVSYLAVMALLVVIWAASGGGYFWPVWPMIGWGFAVVWHGISTFLSDGRPDHRPDKGRR
ncbi:MAG TPA: DUF1707 domain-containing protein [Actinomycetes bacterium]|jgi:hypothetical protein|nr:DUF1707 domain-containing protein [Actinomycetes bacterium]